MRHYSLFADFDDLLCVARTYRRESMPKKVKTPWCWSYEIDPYFDEYLVGVRYKDFFGLKVIGCLHPSVGHFASAFVRRLNEQEGISEQAVTEVERSCEKRATASLTEDGEHVCVRLSGAPLDWFEFDGSDESWSTSCSEGTGVLGAAFVLDANQILQLSLELRFLDRLPKPKRRRDDMSSIICYITGLARIEVQGLLEKPTLQGNEWWLTISLQTASRLHVHLTSVSRRLGKAHAARKESRLRPRDTERG